MFKLDSLHVLLMIALLGVSVNLAIQFAKDSECTYRWKPNPNAMQEACQKNPTLLVCQLKGKN